jgi:hypothetical protein
VAIYSTMFHYARVIFLRVDLFLTDLLCFTPLIHLYPLEKVMSTKSVTTWGLRRQPPPSKDTTYHDVFAARFAPRDDLPCPSSSMTGGHGLSGFLPAAVPPRLGR